MTNNADTQKQEPNWLGKFFIYCSGAEKDIIYQCRSEYNKYALTGSTVLLTGLFAFLTSSYAFYRAFFIDIGGVSDDLAWLKALGIGFFWGILIFNIDKYLVSSMTKNDRWWIQGLKALPRFAIAAFISLTISQPFEIKLYENRIKEKKAEIISEGVKKDVGWLEEKLNSVIEAKEGLVEELRNLEGEKKNKPSYITSLLNQYNQCLREVESLESQNNDEITKIISQKRNLRNQIIPLETSKALYQSQIKSLNNTLNSLSLNDSIQIQKIKNQINDNELEIDGIDAKIRPTKDEIQRLENDEANLRSSVSQKKRYCAGILQDYKNQENNRVTQINKNINVIKNQDTTKQKEIAQINTIYTAEKDTSLKTHKESFGNNLIAEIEILHILIDDEYEKGNKGLWWLNIILSGLIFIIEVLPVLTRLLSSKGAYDELSEQAKQDDIASFNYADITGIEDRKKVIEKRMDLLKEQNELRKEEIEDLKSENEHIKIKAEKQKETKVTEYSSKLELLKIERNFQKKQHKLITEIMVYKENKDKHIPISIIIVIILTILGISYNIADLRVIIIQIAGVVIAGIIQKKYKIVS